MIDCPSPQALSDAAYHAMFSRKVLESRVPISGSIALTDRCNFRCVHCYVGTPTDSVGELTTPQWLALLDEITAAGCLYLVLTGGEPLLHPDFQTIYTHAKTCGLLTTVFTNGSLITPGVIELFCDLPPADIEISLYGLSDSTYQDITGQRGAYARCMRGIGLLHDAGIPFHLKTILMAGNIEEFRDIREFAKRYDADFRFDAAIFPRLDGDPAPLAQRVDPAVAIELELEEPDMVTRWLKYLGSHGAFKPSDKLYQCGTGLTSFHISPTGILQPCALVDRVVYDLTGGSFRDGWKALAAIRELQVDKGSECAQCSNQPLCGLCPAFFRLEHGSEAIKSEFLCAMGHHRAARILDVNSGGSSVREQ